MIESELGGHRCLCVKGSHDAAVALMHGYGASANDLFPLHSLLDPERKWNWYFPEGADNVMFGSEVIGKAWFPIDVARLQLSLMQQGYKSVAMGMSQQLQGKQPLVENLVKEIKAQHSTLVLGGFSQGAILTANYLAESQSPGLHGALLFSPSMAAHWETRHFHNKVASLFASHGRQDPVLPYALTEQFLTLAKDGGIPVDWHPFFGGHEIPPDILSASKQYLATLKLNGEGSEQD